MKDYIRDSNTSGLVSLYSTSIYDAYVWYCKYYSETSTPGVFEKHPLVSKSYFEKYVMENIGIYVVDDKYLSNEWITADDH